MTFNKAEMEKTLRSGLSKYEWNGPRQPQMVEFCDLVGVGIAPVSKKPAVKWRLFASKICGEPESFIFF